MSEYEWLILNELQEQDEPFEVIDDALRGRFKDSGPRDLLEAIFKLYGLGFVSIKQAPIKALGQAFSARELRPAEPFECLGDLRSDYEGYFGGVAHERERGPSVPIGIWIDITDLGQDEFDADGYMEFWPNSPSADPE